MRIAQTLEAVSARAIAWFARLSTGLKLLAIVSIALLPLGLVALLASLEASRNAESEQRAQARVAVLESARKLSAELGSDIIGMRVVLDTGPGGRPGCLQIAQLLNGGAAAPVSFSVYGRRYAPICASRQQAPGRPSGVPPAARTSARYDLTTNRLLAIVRSTDGERVAVASYAPVTLARFAEPAEFRRDYALSLDAPGGAMLIKPAASKGVLGRTEMLRSPVGVLGLTMQMTATMAPFGAIDLLLAFLPLLMWASAALIGFIVVDRLVIRPLRQLNNAVAGYAPGQRLAMAPLRSPSREISELAQSFERMTQAIATHEIAQERSITDQARLTREVHHRVKNNLQVVSSLTNLHARGASSPEARSAYASIQRRVEALAVVHRYLNAEVEESRGVALRPLIGEIAANLRANAPPEASSFAIGLNLQPFDVSQDVAVPVAFLITELTELAMTIDPAARIDIILSEVRGESDARLTLVSSALVASEALREALAARYGRVIDGLSRQLRAGLELDQRRGSYAIRLAVHRQEQA